jgi:hypothetical protein
VSAYTQKDYEAIEAAVLESPRGRWFLGEFARRNRAADTLMLLEAIRKLERGVAESPADQLSADLAAELQDVSETIASTIDRGGRGRAAHGRRPARARQGEDRRAARPTLRYGPGGADGGEPVVLRRRRGPVRVRPGRVCPVAVGRRRAAGAHGATPQTPEAPKGDPKDRIVFIRRGSSKETSIPLADEAEAAGRVSASSGS